jgi:hypothetical protein
MGKAVIYAECQCSSQHRLESDAMNTDPGISGYELRPTGAPRRKLTLTRRTYRKAYWFHRELVLLFNAQALTPPDCKTAAGKS